MAILNDEELKNIGFNSIGSNVKISNKASIYGAKNINIGSNVRIDDFCVLSAGEAGIKIDNNVHIAVYSSLIGKGRIWLKKYSNISSRVSIYSSSDDFTGEFMTNPTVDEKFTNVLVRDVTVGEHVIIGSGTVVLPGVELGTGCAIGAISLVKSSINEFEVFAGNPIRFISNRSHKLITLEKCFESNT